MASLCVFAISSKAQNTFPATGSVGIGTTSPVASSLLEVRSTTKGFLTPRMTTAQRNAIGAPATGLLIYQTDGTAGFYYYYGSGWRQLIYSGANTNLSNLSTTVAVNRSLIANSTGTLDLGSTGIRWRKGFFSDSVVARTVVAGNAATSIGVRATGSGYGVFANGGTYGVYGSGSSYGLYGSGGTYGVYGNGTTYGVYGNSSSNYGVYGNSGYIGVYGVGSSYGLYGYSANSYGVYGSSGYLGVYGNGTSYGTYGYSSGGSGASGYSSSSNGVYGNSYSGYGGSFYSNTSWGLRAETNTGTYAGVFYGSVWSSAGFTTSDRNLKKDVQEFTGAMDIINKLKPKYYSFKDDSKLSFLHLPTGNHYGLIAQEVEEVLPNLVKESQHEDINKGKESIKPSEDGKPMTAEAIEAQKEVAKSAAPESITIKAVNYTELIPILIKGMQEQQVQIKEQEQQIQKLDTKNNDLQGQVDELKSIIAKGSIGSPITPKFGYLKQNAPNPVNNNTVISYYVPDNAGTAQISITDMKGSVLKIYNASKGEGQLSIRTGELPAGTYNYILYQNNKKIDSKQMVIVK